MSLIEAWLLDQPIIALTRDASVVDEGRTVLAPREKAASKSIQAELWPQKGTKIVPAAVALPRAYSRL